MTDLATPASTDSSRRGANLVAAGILLSRLSGLAREVAIGAFLPTAAVVEAFRSAFRIPNLMQNLLGEGVLSASFIPTYRRFLDEGRDADAGRLAGAIAGLLASLTAVLVVVGVLGAQPIARVITPGFPPGSDKFELLVTLVRILTPGIGVLVLSAWCLGVLNSHRSFFLPYVAPVVFNVVATTTLVTAGLVGFTETEAAVALAWGIVAGGVLQFLVQLPKVRRLEPNLTLSVDRGLPGVQRVLRAFGPVVGARGVVQISSLVDLSLASFLATGGFAAIGFAQVLYVLPISLFGMSIAAAELPELASMDASDREATRRRVHAALERVAFYVVPVTFVFFLAGDAVIGALYFTFEPAVVTQVGAVLGVYALALVPTTASRVIQSLRYGLDDTRTPARASIVRVVVSTVAALLLMFPLDRVGAGDGGLTVIGELLTFTPVSEALRGDGASALRYGALAFGLAATLGAWTELAVLRRACDRDVGRLQLGGGRLARILVAAAPVVVGGVVLTPGRGYLGLAVIGLLAGVAYVVLAARLGIDEASQLLRLLGRGDGDPPADSQPTDRPPAGAPPADGPSWSLKEARRIQAMERARRARTERPRR